MQEVKKKPKKTSKKEKKKNRPHIGHLDFSFLFLVIIITSVGLIMLLSASYATSYDQYEGDSSYLFWRQFEFAILGMIVMIAISFINYQYMRALSIPLLIISVILLLMIIPFGIRLGGAKRWLRLFGIQFQPSEIAKIAVIVMFSNLISVYKEKMRTFKYGVLPFIAVLAVILGLMALQPHISGIVIIAVTAAVLMVVGGMKLKWLVGTALAAVPFAAALIAFVPYAQTRIRIWLDPYVDAEDKGYQTIQSWYTIGSGGLLGQGIGQSRQKYLYLPEVENDFVFSVTCEEIGFIGACLILVLFSVLLIRGYWIALHAKDRFGALLVTGIITQLGLQTILNIGVVTGLLPNTGISLPFFSYGGTALIIQMAEMGIVLSVSRTMIVVGKEPPNPPKEEIGEEFSS